MGAAFDVTDCPEYSRYSEKLLGDFRLPLYLCPVNLRPEQRVDK